MKKTKEQILDDVCREEGWIDSTDAICIHGNITVALFAMDAYADQETAELRRKLREVEDERETMIAAFSEIREQFTTREWLMDGRGSYPYNDDRYKEEVRYIMDAFNAIEQKMWRQIKSKTHEYREITTAPLKKEVEELRRQIDELKEQNRKLNFMLDNGLGDSDMKNDI